MKSIKVFLSLLCMLVVCVALVGCNNAKNRENFAGTWELESAQAGNNDDALTTEDIAALKMAGYNIIINLRDEGTYEYDMLGEVVAGEWEALSESEATMEVGDEPVELEILNGKLSFTQNAQVFYFVETDAAIGSGAGTGPVFEDAVEDSPQGNDDEYLGDAWIMADDRFCTFLVYSEDADEKGNPGYSVRIVNNHSKTIRVSAERGSFSVNGAGADIELMEKIHPGEYVDTEMYFDGEEIGGGLEVLMDVSGTILVTDAQTSEILSSIDFIM